MVDNSEEFWNNEYWKNVINENKTDFMKDSWMAKYLNHITNVENKKAIDLGCGIGQDTKYLLDKGFDVVSCDFFLCEEKVATTIIKRTRNIRRTEKWQKHMKECWIT